MPRVFKSFKPSVPTAPKGMSKEGRNRRVNNPCTSIEVQSGVQSESGATLSTQAIKLIVENCVRQEVPKTMPYHKFDEMVDLIFNKIMDNTGSFENGYQGYLSDSRLCEDLVFSLFNANKREIWPYWL